jgi:AraC-like DNA-binding protein
MRMTLERSPNAPIRLSELAALTGLSMSHFSVAFKQSTGMPPHRWQLQARVLNAKQLLRRRELRISEVAKLTGFVDQSHFTRTFRQFVRLTPMTWRREMLG